jgi:hypothetical protein
MLLMIEKVTKKASVVGVPEIRYSDSVTAAVMLIVYFPQLTRCGNMFLVSLYRRTHCRNRQIGGRAVRKPRSRE